MINFASVKNMIIPEGAVKRVIGADGAVLWSGKKQVVLTVQKITSDTYAAETTYEDETFILLDIYPKTNGTVTVTYGGLTKTITDTSGAEEPNAQRVFFGVFNGVSDGVETPDSGTLTIEGDCRGFGCGEYSTSSKGFTYASVITSVVDWGNVKYMPSYVFAGCTALTSVTIPDGVTSIGNFAFQDCTGLTSVDIPSSVTSIHNSAFLHCSGLTSVVVEDGNSVYHSSGNCLIETASKKLFLGCKSSVIPTDGSVTSIGDSAFQDCTGLTSVDIPSSVTSIGEYAFDGCSSLTNATIPSGVTSVGKRAFQYCAVLTSVTIPASVTTIGEAPWSGCDNALPFTVLPTTPPTYIKEQYAIFAGTDAAANKNIKTVIVPKGCLDAYKAADGWSTYADYMMEAT